MLYLALATDYDGTLAHDGRAEPTAVEALMQLKAAGKRLLLVTGREMLSLKKAFAEIELFDIIVAENGAVLYFPQTREERLIAPAPPASFVTALKAQGIEPLSVGRSIVATWSPNEGKVLDTIRHLNLDWQVIFNKGAVMCLPPGINKASGLLAALEELQLSPVNTVAVGDAENDLAFLKLCGCAVAVGNAIVPVKEAADVTTVADHGAGLAEFITQWLDDSATAFRGIRRHDLYLGDCVEAGKQVVLNADRGAILIAGSSGAGKSRLTTLLVERLTGSGYQVVIVDPEGDYGKLEPFTHLGDTSRTAAPEEAQDALSSPRANVVLNLLATDITQRPDYGNKLIGLISGSYLTTGRPHWVVFDEAHHLFPRSNERDALPAKFPAIILVTTHADNLSRAALSAVNCVIAVGNHANDVISDFCRLTEEASPKPAALPNDDQVIYWMKGSASVLLGVGKSRQQHQRHARKYAEGRLGEDISFYFKGADGALNLRAFNLAAFLQLAQGVDENTWLFHLHRGDYSRWFQEIIKDDSLASDGITAQGMRDADESRQFIAEAIRKRYIITTTDC